MPVDLIHLHCLTCCGSSAEGETQNSSANLTDDVHDSPESPVVCRADE
jgi:hypothetical protein